MQQLCINGATILFFVMEAAAFLFRKMPYVFDTAWSVYEPACPVFILGHRFFLVSWHLFCSRQPGQK